MLAPGRAPDVVCPGQCGCADMDGTMSVNAADLNLFGQKLIGDPRRPVRDFVVGRTPIAWTVTPDHFRRMSRPLRFTMFL